MVLAPACPVCLEGAETVRDDLLADRARRPRKCWRVWMEALPFDITRNPARRNRDLRRRASHDPFLRYADKFRGRGFAGPSCRLAGRESALGMSSCSIRRASSGTRVCPCRRPGFTNARKPTPTHYRTGADLTQALQAAVGRPVVADASVRRHPCCRCLTRSPVCSGRSLCVGLDAVTP